jgi:hypothetical protein
MAEKVVINSSRVVQEVSIVSQPNITKVYINNNGGGGANFNLDVSELGDAPINNVNSIVFEGAVVTDLGSRAVKVEISGGGLSLIRQEFTFTSSQIFTLLDDYSQVYSVEVQGQGALSTSQYSLLPPNQVEILDTLDASDYVVIIYSANTGGVIPYYTQAQVDALLAALPSGAVASVNGQTGVVVLDADDISDASTTNKFATASEKTKIGFISVTQVVDLDQIESDTITNNAKVSNATHTGDVTGSTTLTIANDAVTNAKMANMATKTYKGRTSGTTGDPEDVSVATLKTDLVLVKGDVGLGSVDNTADLDKPISTATQTALNLKQDTLVSGTNIKTINGNSILGSGNLTISGGGGITAEEAIGYSLIFG